MPRDNIRGAMHRVHSATLANTTVEVFQPSVAYRPGDGFDVSYPDTPDATLDARVDGQNAGGEKERGGTNAEIDATVRVRDDVSVQLTGYGEDGEASARLVDTDTGIEYRVESVVNPSGGITELQVVER
jgi:hypothetical protein